MEHGYSKVLRVNTNIVRLIDGFYFLYDQYRMSENNVGYTDCCIENYKPVTFHMY